MLLRRTVSASNLIRQLEPFLVFAIIVLVGSWVDVFPWDCWREDIFRVLRW